MHANKPEHGFRLPVSRTKEQSEISLRWRFLRSSFLLVSKVALDDVPVAVATWKHRPISNESDARLGLTQFGTLSGPLSTSSRLADIRDGRNGYQTKIRRRSVGTTKKDEGPDCTSMSDRTAASRVSRRGICLDGATKAPQTSRNEEQQHGIYCRTTRTDKRRTS